MTEDVEKINLAMSTAETFSNLYYKKMDSDRHTIEKMYHENATMTWNGNPIDGIGSIQKFWLEKIPKSSTFVQSLGININNNNAFHHAFQLTRKIILPSMQMPSPSMTAQLEDRPRCW